MGCLCPTEEAWHLQLLLFSDQARNGDKSQSALYFTAFGLKMGTDIIWKRVKVVGSSKQVNEVQTRATAQRKHYCLLIVMPMPMVNLLERTIVKRIVNRPQCQF